MRRNQQRIDIIAVLATRIREHCDRQLNGELESPREFLKGLHDLTWKVQNELKIKKIKTLTKTWGMSVITPDPTKSLRSTSPTEGRELAVNQADTVPAMDGGHDSSPELLAYLDAHKLTLKKGTWWMIKGDVNSKDEQKFGAPQGLPHLHGKRILTNGIDCLIELDNGTNAWVLLDNWVFDPPIRGGRSSREIITDDALARILAALE